MSLIHFGGVLQTLRPDILFLKIWRDKYFTRASVSSRYQLFHHFPHYKRAFVNLIRMAAETGAAVPPASSSFSGLSVSRVSLLKHESWSLDEIESESFPVLF